MCSFHTIEHRPLEQGVYLLFIDFKIHWHLRLNYTKEVQSTFFSGHPVYGATMAHAYVILILLLPVGPDETVIPVDIILVVNNAIIARFTHSITFVL